MSSKMWDEIIHPFHTSTVHRKRMNNFIPSFTYPCWDYYCLFNHDPSDSGYQQRITMAAYRRQCVSNLRQLDHFFIKQVFQAETKK